MKEAINRKLNDLKGDNEEMLHDLKNNYSLKWRYRTPDEPKWQMACRLIDRLYANSTVIRLLEKQLEETD